MSTRSNRHVILEGPDGAGKSTLAKYIAATCDLPMARRVSDSIKGVQGKNLARYVDGDMNWWANYASADPAINRSAFSDMSAYTPSRVYDRYPLISEPIYGLHVRKSTQVEFGTNWYRDSWQKFLAFDPLVIFCLPPYDEVVKHVHPNRDMDGVWRNISQLYQAYRIESLKFPGRSIVYNYTIHKPGQIVDAVARHIEL